MLKIHNLFIALLPVLYFFAPATVPTHLISDGDAIFEINFTNITELKLPVYFFIGRHDWSLTCIVTEDFLKN